MKTSSDSLLSHKKLLQNWKRLNTHLWMKKETQYYRLLIQYYKVKSIPNKHIPLSFNILELFEKSINENTHSDILRHFFKYTTFSDLKEKLLFEYLQIVYGHYNKQIDQSIVRDLKNGNYTVRREVAENDSRIDIEIKFDDNIIWIENKLFSAETQNNQTIRHEKNINAHRDKFKITLIYLSPYYTIPKSSNLFKSILYNSKVI